MKMKALLLLILPLSIFAQDIFTPKEKIDFLADPELKDFTHFINKNKALTMKRDEVWKITDGQMHISGKVYGYIRTKKKYQNYHIVLEYRWDEHTYLDRIDKARDCGLLMHAYGKDGAAYGSWMYSIESQLIEGGSGDILVLANKEHPTRVSSEVTFDRDKEPVWKKGAEKQVFPNKKIRINWKDRDPDWKDVRGYNGSKEVENPVGEWNRMEVICREDTIKIYVNGVLVNEATNATPSSGYICLQSEAAELSVRRYELWPLDTFKEKWLAEKRSTDTGYSASGESLLPRKAPWSPEKQKEAFKIDGDYELQLVAREPLIQDPVDVAWDEKGQMFVAQMSDYPLPTEKGKRLSQIRLLKDTNNDGVMDKSFIWADGVDQVQNILYMNGGILATTWDKTIFLKDSNGDNKADIQKVILKYPASKHNQLMPSSPHWGIDNQIYFNNGLNLSMLTVDETNKSTKLVRKNFRYNPYTKEVEAMAAYGQYGAAQDDWGRDFCSSNRNPTMFAPLPLEMTNTNKNAKYIKPYEDIQPSASRVWPLMLSHTTANAHAGTYTAACGIQIYRNNLVPDLYGDVLVCDPTAQLITRSKMNENGSSLKAERVGHKKDFIVSGDEWFRPVNLRNGPDGALYICDMYRRFIDHSRFFPDSFSKSHYMRAGLDHGRIWKLVPKGQAKQAIKPLTQDLVKNLESPLSWVRVNSQRLLVEKKAIEKENELRKLLKNSKFPQAKIHALWALHGLAKLTESDVISALKDADPKVIENGILISSQMDSNKFQNELKKLLKSKNLRVQTLAIAHLKSIDSDQLNQVISILKSNPADKWLIHTIASKIGAQSSTILTGLLSHVEFVKNTDQSKTELINEFAYIAGKSANKSEINKVLKLINDKAQWWHFSLANGLNEGLGRSPLKQKNLIDYIVEYRVNVDEYNGLVRSADKILLDKSKTVAERLVALPLSRRSHFDEMKDLVQPLLQADQTSEIQEAAINSLIKGYRSEYVSEYFFESLDSLPPKAKETAVAYLTGKTSNSIRLLKDIKGKKLSKGIIPPMKRWVFSRSSNEELKALAKEIYGAADSDREALIQKYSAALKNGDPLKGKQVFQKACFTCHKTKGIGFDVGPPLSDVAIKPAAALLTDILDPNRMVEDRWSSYQIELKDGSTKFGIIASEDSDNIILKLPGGASETIPRSDVKKITSNGMSLMPVGLEGIISEKEMSDLISFLKEKK